MAKRRATRKRSRLLKGVVNESLALSTLANNALISSNFSDTVQERTFAISAEITWLLRDATSLEAGIVCGLAHSDYTSAEIEAYIEATGTWDEGDLVQQEIMRRKIRTVGMYEGVASDMPLNNGQPIKTKLGFILNQGDTLKHWAYNRSGGTLTTGSIQLVNGHVWLRPTG